MKRILVALVALMLAFTVSAFAESRDYSALTDDELQQLFQEIGKEMEKRGLEMTDNDVASVLVAATKADAKAAAEDISKDTIKKLGEN